jgi:hypothetical protein
VTILALTICAAMVAAAFWFSGALMTLVGAALMIRVESPLAARTAGRQLLGGAYLWMHSMTAIIAGLAASLAVASITGPMSPSVMVIGAWTIVFVWLLVIGAVALLPELGVWGWLQRTDVAISIAAGLSLAAYAVVQARAPADTREFTVFAIAGIVAALIGFELGVRSGCLGAVTRFDEIASNGSAPESEARLRRHVRRIKPFTLAASSLLVFGMAVLLSRYVGKG